MSSRMTAQGAFAPNFQDLVERSSEIIAVLDREGRIAYTNPALEGVLGYAAETASGRSIWDFVDPADADRVREALQALAREPGSRKAIDLRARHRDGSWRELEAQAAILPAEGGPLVVVNAHDVTERRRVEQDLRRTRDLLDAIVRATPLGVMLLDFDARVRLWNPGMERVFGWTADEVLGEPYPALRGDQRQEHRGLMDQLLGGATLSGLELDRQRKDGSPIRIRSWSTVVRDAAGEVVGFVGLLEDVTEARRAEEQSRRTADTLAALLAASPLPVMALDAEGRVLFWNPAAERMFGWTAEEIVGRLDPLVPAEGRDVFRRGLERSLAGESHSLDVVRLHKDGRPIEVAISTAPLHDGQGQVVGAVGILADVTEKARARRTLQEANARLKELETIVTGSAAIAFRLSTAAGWPVEYISDNIRQYGYAPEDLVGRSIQAFIRAEDRSRVVGEIERRVAHGETGFWQECPVVSKAGQARTLETRIWVQRDAAGDHLAGVLFDVTERRRIEELLRQTQKLESLGVLAGGVAHDFNNLLGVVVGHAALAKKSLGPDQPALRHLGRIQSAAERAAELARKMLAFSGRGRFELRRLELAAFARERQALLESAIPRHVVLELPPATPVAEIEADPSQLEQILLVLVQNAAEATDPAAGRVLVRVGQREVGPEDTALWRHTGAPLVPGTYATLEVSDDGCGIEPGALDRVFEPFYTTKLTGRGLGLPAVLGIVRGHGGGIRVESVPGQGSRFELAFPLAAAAARDVEPRRALASGGVLVVDDESTLREVLLEVLGEAGLSTWGATGGGEALRLLRELGEQVGVVVLDLSMPGISGAETLRSMRELRPELNVIVISGYDAHEADQRLEGQRADGFLHKPFTPDALLAAVRRVLA
jgi:two-component system cell cycle sensor histidine kinase/response regulator CckA